MTEILTVDGDVSGLLRWSEPVIYQIDIAECYGKLGNSMEWIGKIPCVGKHQTGPELPKYED